MQALRLHWALVHLLSTVAFAACADASLSGNSSTSQRPAAASPVRTAQATAVAPASGGDATANTGSGLDQTGGGTPTAEPSVPAQIDPTDAGASGVGPLTVNKTIGGLAIDDKPITFTLSDAGAGGAPQTVTFDAGQSGSQQIPGLCHTDGTPTTITVSTSVPGGLEGLLGTGATAKLSGSTVSYDPATCILSEIISQGKGDTFTFTCPNNTPVTLSN